MDNDLINWMPADMADEFDALMQGVDDQTVGPAQFLEEIDDFIRRLCERSGISYEKLYGADYKERYHDWLCGDQETPPPTPRAAVS